MKYSAGLQEKFDEYAEILRDWQSRINLVARRALCDIQSRHIDDSAQLAEYLPLGATVIDLGSGAGFPAAVLAILGYKVTAIESIGKKARFLEELKSRLDLPNLTVENNRVENYLRSKAARQLPKNYVFTARAFAPLVKILDYIAPSGAAAYLLKGARVREEIAKAKEKYDFDFELFPSRTGDGFMVRIENIAPRAAGC